MSKSSFKFKVTKTANSFQGFKMLKHQVRVEIVAKNGMKKLNVAHIINDLILKANEHEKVDFLDIKGQPFDNDNFPEDQEFVERLGAETVEMGKNAKVTLGFFMVSTANLQRIKKSIGFSWLHQQQIYIRNQRMPFSEGTDMYLMGYLLMEHTSFADPTEIERNISDKWYSYMDKMAAEHEMTKDDVDFLEHVQMLEEAKIIVNDELKIPISTERTVVKVESKDNKAFEVPVFQIFIPRRFNKAATYLNDRALLETQTLKNMIPFSIAKNAPEVFYKEMTAHAKFLHDHRFITIKNVTKSEFSTTLPMDPTDEERNKTLHHALASNKSIDHIHPRAEKNTVIVTMNMTKVKETEKWLDNILPTYPYKPTRDEASTTLSIGSTRTGKYSKIFGTNKETESTTESSFDPSTIASTISPRTKNAWNNGPPVNVSFNRRQQNRVSMNIGQDNEEMNQYNQNDSSNNGDYGINDYEDDKTSRNSQKSTNMDSIQTEVSAMVEKALAAERLVLEEKFKSLERQQQEFNERVKEWDKKISDMKNEIVESTVQGTVTLLTGTMTPFATKEDNIKLQEQTSTVIHNAVNTTNNEIASLKEGISALLQRTNHLFASIHDPDETSPPRKTRSIQDPTEPPNEGSNPIRLFQEEADTAMKIMDSVGET